MIKTSKIKTAAILKKLAFWKRKPGTRLVVPTTVDEPADMSRRAAFSPKVDEEMKSGAMGAAIGGLAALALLNAQPAQAQDVAGIVAQIVNTFMGKVMEQVVGDASDNIRSGIDNMNQSVTGAVGVMSDSVRQQMLDQYNKDIENGVRPAPNQCTEQGVAAVLGAVSGASASRRKSSSGSSYQSRAAVEDTFKKKVADVRTYDANFKNGEATDASVFLKHSAYTPKEFAAAMEFVKWATKGPFSDSRSLEKLAGQKQSGQDLEYRAKWLAESAKASAAEDALFSVVARRETHPQALSDVMSALSSDKDPNGFIKAWVNKRSSESGGLSELDLMALEIARTYENPEWRDQLLREPSANVMLRSLCQQMAFQNKLIFEDLLMNEHALVMQALSATRV